MGKSTKEKVEHEKNYIKFLEKKLASKNWLTQATLLDVEHCKVKLKKSRLRLKLLRKDLL